LTAPVTHAETAPSGSRPTFPHDVAFYVPWLSPLLANGDLPPAGGAETQIFLVARALAKRGVRVSMSAFADPKGTIPPVVDSVDIALREPYRGGRGLLGVIREALAMRRALGALGARVIVTRIAGPHVGLVGLFAKLQGRRFVYSSANVTDFDFGALKPSVRDRILYRLGLNLADDIVVQTDEQSRLCQAKLGRTPIVIKNIAEAVAMREAEPEAFLWAGRVAWYKGPLAYIELAHAVPEATFWMVPVPTRDSGSLVDAIRRAAADVPNLELLEPVPRSELMTVVERSVAIVNTSVYEGMPNVTLEGWARGVPALTLSYDPDGVIERYGLGVFAQGSRERLVAAATELWRGRHDQTEVAGRCRAYVAEHHSEDTMCRQWLVALHAARASRRRG
jgi:glycosyltransferase involved in cell wall biosynthesis